MTRRLTKTSSDVGGRSGHAIVARIAVAVIDIGRFDIGPFDVGARLIVTRNGADFANSPVPAVAPGALLALLAAQGAGGQAGAPAGETGT